MRALLVCLGVGAALLAPPRGFARTEESRNIRQLSEGWRFITGDPVGAAQAIFDDSGWAEVRVPHDWAISGPMDKNGDANSKFNWHGEGWYRYHFTPTTDQAGQAFYLDFDGVMAFPKVYVNGQLAGSWDYGYNSFRVDATPYVVPGQDNVIAVHADTRDHWSRWYPGAGIYRKVTLSVLDPIHVGQWGTSITTPKVSEDEAQVQIKTTIENTLQDSARVTLTTTLYSPEQPDVPAAVATDTVAARAAGTSDVTQVITLRRPQLWEVGNGRLYHTTSVLSVNGITRDVFPSTFGIRTIVFTKDDGLLVNGKRVQIHGADLHHDQGPLGAAFHTRAAERQLQIMANMGANAIRTSHNPAAPELLDLADRMGLLVFAECFDKWDQTADRLPSVDLRAFGQRQIDQFIHRDRNHPSIMIWSIGNEIWDLEANWAGNAAAQVGMMADFVRAADPTRPVTMATHMPQSLDTGLHAHLDVQSWNYGRKYVLGRRYYPNMPVLMSESASAVSTRADYTLPLPRVKEEFPTTPVVSSFDLNAVSWGDIADTEFQAIAAHPYVAGEFVWSGFDYIGEPTPFDNIARSSYFGIVDLVGLVKDRYYLYRSYWRPDVETVHILPHWTWPNRVGQTVPVFVYTNGDSAELFLNGRSLGKKSKLDPQARLPANLSIKQLATSSSDETAHNNVAKNANDGDPTTRWCAADGSANAWWQVDLGRPQAIKSVFLNFEQDASNYQYKLQSSLDGTTWQTLAEQTKFAASDAGASFEVAATSRFLRVQFTALKPGVWASLREFEVYDSTVDRSYYAVTRGYRLRWDNVTYAPGELTAVAYQGDRPIGEAHVRTASAPTRLEFQPDRRAITADGDDLSYITVTARDDRGTIDPNGSQMVHLQLRGPGELLGVGNGDPNSQDPFVADDVRLFHGKAMVIVRGQAHRSGTLAVTGSSPQLEAAAVNIVTH